MYTYSVAVKRVLQCEVRHRVTIYSVVSLRMPAYKQTLMTHALQLAPDEINVLNQQK